MTFWPKWLSRRAQEEICSTEKAVKRIYHIYDDNTYLEIEFIDNIAHDVKNGQVVARTSKENPAAEFWDPIYKHPQGGGPFPLKHLGITLKELRACVSEKMPEYDQVICHDTGLPEIARHIYAFGEDDKPSFFVLVGLTGIVQNMTCKEAGDFLFLLPQRDRLLLIDWVREQCISLGDELALKQYIEEH